VELQIIRVETMDWFKKHLNLTLGLLLIIWIIILGGAFFGLFGFPGSASKELEDSFWINAVVFCVLDILYLVSLFAVNWWILKQKNRNELWLLLFFVPLGFIGIIFLSNLSKNNS
jgi:hypothetical protein